MYKAVTSAVVFFLGVYVGVNCYLDIVCNIRLEL